MLTKLAYSTLGKPLIPAAPRQSAAQSTYATLLCAELRGYEALAEKLPPVEVAAMLEQFFDVLSGAVLECGGQIFHLAGPDMMAGFGVRDIHHTQLEETLTAARIIQRRFSSIRAAWQRKYSIDAAVGIGIHRGEVAAGSFGPREHAMLTLVGDAANVAARLCRRARAGEILLSAAAHPCPPSAAQGLEASDSMPLKLLPKISLLGRAAPMDLWCVPVAERPPMRHACPPARETGG